MKVSFKNVGIVKHGSIELDDITVIAGQNGLGKSTIGKSIFCALNTFYKSGENIREERFRQIKSILLENARTTSRNTLGFITASVDKILSGFDETGTLIIPDGLMDLYENNSRKPIYNRIRETLEVDSDSILQTILERRLDAEFSGQITPVNHIRRKTSINIEIDKENKLSVMKENKKQVVFSKSGDVNYHTIIIDDPYALDHLSNTTDLMNDINRFSHRGELLEKLVRDADQDSVISHILAKQSWEEINVLISAMCDGTLERASSFEYTYSSYKYQQNLSLENLSTGLKNILLIKTLIDKGYLNSRTILTLDEPEVHLHPEWQFMLARVLVLLPVVSNIKVLISTHSSDFLSAIDYYTRESRMKLKRHFYLMEKDDAYAVTKDVTNNIDLLYGELNTPFLSIANKL